MSKEKLSVKQWADEDKPREKMLAKGIRALSSAELIAIVIGSGTNEESAVDLGKRILNHVNNSLTEAIVTSTAIAYMVMTMMVKDSHSLILQF